MSGINMLLILVCIISYGSGNFISSQKVGHSEDTYVVISKSFEGMVAVTGDRRNNIVFNSTEDYIMSDTVYLHLPHIGSKYYFYWVHNSETCNAFQHMFFVTSSDEELESYNGVDCKDRATNPLHNDRKRLEMGEEFCIKYIVQPHTSLLVRYNIEYQNRKHLKELSYQNADHSSLSSGDVIYRFAHGVHDLSRDGLYVPYNIMYPFYDELKKRDLGISPYEVKKRHLQRLTTQEIPNGCHVPGTIPENPREQDANHHDNFGEENGPIENQEAVIPQYNRIGYSDYITEIEANFLMGYNIPVIEYRIRFCNDEIRIKHLTVAVPAYEKNEIVILSELIKTRFRGNGVNCPYQQQHGYSQDGFFWTDQPTVVASSPETANFHNRFMWVQISAAEIFSTYLRHVLYIATVTNEVRNYFIFFQYVSNGRTYVLKAEYSHTTGCLVRLYREAEDIGDCAAVASNCVKRVVRRIASIGSSSSKVNSVSTTCGSYIEDRRS